VPCSSYHLLSSSRVFWLSIMIMMMIFYFTANDYVTDPSCQDAFQVGSTCYKIHKERVRWFTAVNRCLSYNASLAVFDDYVRRYFPSSLLSNGHNAWIGLVRSWWTWPGLGQPKSCDISLNDGSQTFTCSALFDVILLYRG